MPEIVTIISEQPVHPDPLTVEGVRVDAHKYDDTTVVEMQRGRTTASAFVNGDWGFVTLASHGVESVTLERSKSDSSVIYLTLHTTTGTVIVKAFASDESKPLAVQVI